MKKTIILLKAFPVFLILLPGCNNIEHKPEKEEREEIEENIFIFSPDLNDKYYDEKLCCLDSAAWLSSPIKYSGSLIVEELLIEKYNSFIKEDIYKYSQCILFGDSLYVAIDNGDVMTNKLILLKIKKNKHEIIVIRNSDIEFSIFTPVESTLRTSLNEFHVGDTIIGEISLSYRDSLYLLDFRCGGHFMGVISQGTEEWKEILHILSRKRFFSTNKICN